MLLCPVKGLPGIDRAVAAGMAGRFLGVWDGALAGVLGSGRGAGLRTRKGGDAPGGGQALK